MSYEHICDDCGFKEATVCRCSKCDEAIKAEAYDEGFEIGKEECENVD